MALASALTLTVILNGCGLSAGQMEHRRDKAQGVEWFHCRVVQIVDDENMLALATPDWDYADPFRAGTVTNLAPPESEHLIWIQGFLTAGYADGYATPAIKLRMTGTKRYESTNGVRTVEIHQFVARVPAGMLPDQ